MPAGHTRLPQVRLRKCFKADCCCCSSCAFDGASLPWTDAALSRPELVLCGSGGFVNVLNVASETEACKFRNLLFLNIQERRKTQQEPSSAAGAKHRCMPVVLSHKLTETIYIFYQVILTQRSCRCGGLSALFLWKQIILEHQAHLLQQQPAPIDQLGYCNQVPAR